MKKITLIIVLFIAANSLFAESHELFSYDKNNVSDQFSQLQLLENQVTQLSGISGSDILNTASVLNFGIAHKVSLSLSENFIAGYLLGCILGPIGVLIVVIAEPGTGSFSGSVMGCLTTSCLLGGFYWWLPRY